MDAIAIAVLISYFIVVILGLILGYREGKKNR